MVLCMVTQLTVQPQPFGVPSESDDLDILVKRYQT